VKSNLNGKNWLAVGSIAGRAAGFIEKLEEEKKVERLEVDCRYVGRVRWKRFDSRKRVVKEGEVRVEIKVLEVRE
jgi:hypothetical protein